MRTTLTLDKDVAAMVERLRKARRQSLKALVNDALREGLKSLAARNRARVHVETESVDLGRCLVRDVDDLEPILRHAVEPRAIDDDFGPHVIGVLDQISVAPRITGAAGLVTSHTRRSSPPRT